MSNNPTEISFKLLDFELKLHRYPSYHKEQLRAWDAGDEYVLKHIAENNLVTERSKIVVINDSFGALSLGLKKQFPCISIHSICDSYTARRGLEKNARINELDIGDIGFDNSLTCSSTARYPADLILIKVPKSLAHLEFQITQLAPWISNTSQLIGVGMVKNIHSSTVHIFEQNAGTTTTSLARKKARLIFCKPDKNMNTTGASPEKISCPAEDIKSTAPLTLVSYPGVFSHGKLDIGTRFLLENLHTPKGNLNILDLGCGSGALGITAALQNPDARVTFVDESFLATESAKLSATESVGCIANMRFLTTHCLDGIESNSQDLILNNPPFHDAGAKTTGIALEMFQQSKRVLKNGGQLVVIANRHLGHHVNLRDCFGNCETITGNKKFVVLKAINS